ncbi:hypothetical protein EV018_07090 [Citrobacter freundii]|nr:hypothetical protein EV018_07090 [Citrobacter freundii]
MRSTTARPAMFLGRGRPCSHGDAAWIFCGDKQPLRHRYCRAGAAGAAVLQGRQAKRGGDVPKGLPLECKRQRAAPQARSHRHQGAAEKKCAAPQGSAPDGTRRDQFAVIVCNCSITPGSTKTHGWSAAIGTLNT